VIGAEARGFLLGPALARELGAGFVLARKPGKLPSDTVRAEYVLEYGTDALELHSDAVASGARVLVHDDLLATGGTAKTLCRLVEQLGGTVAGCGFLIELAFLEGRRRLAGYDVHALITYDAE
jgi:adenine phosphoribosyltransferase